MECAGTEEHLRANGSGGRNAVRGRRGRRCARVAADRRTDHHFYRITGLAAHDPKHVQDRRRTVAGSLPCQRAVHHTRKDERVAAAELLGGMQAPVPENERQAYLDAIHDALYAAKTAKAAGFSVIGVLSEAVEEGDRIALQKLCDRCITDYTALLGELLPPEDR